MNVLVNGGFQMRVNDGSPYWSYLQARLQALGHQVRLREAVGYGMGVGPDSCQPVDLMWSEGVIGYSDGFATYKVIEHGIFAHGQDSVKNKKIVVGVAPVADIWFSQFGGLCWHLYDAIETGVCFNVQDIPASSPFLETEKHKVVTQDFTAFDLKAVDLKTNRLNVNCDSVFPGITIPSTKHKGVANHTAVLDAIVSLFSLGG